MKLSFISSLSVSVAVLAGLITGCTTTTTSTQDEWLIAQAGFQVGMTQEEMRELLGPPGKVKAAKPSTSGRETWIYRRSVRLGSTVRQTGQQMVEYPDPITGIVRMIPEPTYSQVNTYADDELELEWMDGHLVNWQQTRRKESSFHN